jgi:hypothetical protein
MHPEENPPMYSADSPHTQPGAKPSDAERTDLVNGKAHDQPAHDQPAREQGDSSCQPDRLHICFHCAGELTYPLDWSEEGARHWRIVLRCPECESRREGVFEQGVVERLDDELDRAAGVLLGDLRRMTHANMSEEVEFFVRALAADLIIPSDF